MSTAAAIPAEIAALWTTVLGSSRAAQVIAGLGASIRSMSATELATIPGITPRRAASAAAVVELGRRLMSCPLQRGQKITCAEDVYAAYGPRLVDVARESFTVVYLDTKARVICDEVTAIGTAGQCPVSPAEVYRTAVRVGAQAVIALHNHPSGDCTPSLHDDQVTEHLLLAGELIGVQLLDHIIVGDGAFYSYARSSPSFSHTKPTARPRPQRRLHVLDR